MAVSYSEIDQMYQGRFKQEESLGALGTIKDIGKGIAHGVYDSLDAMTFDALPDWDTSYISRPTGFFGKAVGTITQFAIPYGAVTKVVGAAAKGASVTTKSGRVLKWLSGEKAAAGTKAALAARAAGDSTLALSKLAIGANAAAIGSSVARGTIIGGFADFLAFDASEERLSDVIQANPRLANPVTEFLAHDGEESEVEGRLKNVLEGAGLGSIFETVVALGRGYRAGRAAAKAGASPEQIQTAKIAASEDSLEAAKVKDDIIRDANLESSLDEVSTVQGADGPVSVTGREVQAEVDKVAKKVVDGINEATDPTAPSVPAKGAEDLTLDEITAGIEANPALQWDADKFKSLVYRRNLSAKDKEYTDFWLDQIAKNTNQSDVRAALDAGLVREIDEIQAGEFAELLSKEGSRLSGLGDNPRVKTAAHRALDGQIFQDANLSMIIGSKDGAVRLTRAMEQGGFSNKPLTTNNIDDMAQAVKSAVEFGNLSAHEAKIAIASLAEGPEIINEWGRKMIAYGVLAVRISDEVGANIEKIISKPDITIEESMTAAYSFKTWRDLSNGVFGIRSALGRNLQRASIELNAESIEKAMGDNFTYKPLDDLLAMDTQNFDANKVRNLMKRLNEVMQSPNAMDNMKAAQKLLEAPTHEKLQAVVLEYHINALLSGVGTQAVNLISAATMTFWRPMEKMLGAALDGSLYTLKGNKAEAKKAMRIFNEEFGMIGELFSNLTTAWRMSRQSGGSPFSSRSALEGPRYSAIRTLGEGTKYEDISNYLAKTVNLPSQFLEGGDDFMKTWNGMSRSRQRLKSMLIEEGADPLEIESLVQERLQFMMQAKGKLKQEALIRKALGEAQGENIPKELMPLRAKELMKFSDPQIQEMLDIQEAAKLGGKEVTLTTDLAEGVIGTVAAAASSVSQRHPLTRLLLPFVRTPANIADAAWDRTVGGALGAASVGLKKTAKRLGFKGEFLESSSDSMLRLERRLASGDPRVRQEAMTHMAMGITVVGTIAALTSVENTDDPRLPKLTGSGPKSPEVRAALVAAGWQPFSVRIGDKYVSYSRLDPFASILGIVADASEYLREHDDEEGGNDVSSVLLATASAVANNITSKTYVQGISNVMDLATDPDRNGERVLGSVAGSFIPTILANVEKVVDPQEQQIRDITDRLMSRVPGLSDNLAPKRDLLGDPMTRPNTGTEFFLPIRITKVKDGTVEAELSRYAYGFSQPTTTKAGVDLLDDAYRSKKGQEAYDRYLELSGSVKIYGRDLRQALRKLIKSNEYQRLPADKGPDGSASPRIGLVNSVFRQYRSKAWDKLLKENPTLRDDVRKTAQVKQDRRRGRVPLTL